MQTEITTEIVTEVRQPDRNRYQQCVELSKQIRWEIERDVLKHRDFDFSTYFMPDGLSLVNELEFLRPDERRLFSQIQGRTYANIFGLVERFINAKVLELSRDHWFGDQHALEAMVRFSDEELKHQELFRRIEEMMAMGMPSGYQCLLDPNEVAHAVLASSTWAVLALTCHIELFTLEHYKASIAPNPSLSPLFKDIFRYHWMEESQHAVLDELEWRRADAKLTHEERERAVDEFIALVGAVDYLLQVQSNADVAYFLAVCGRDLDDREVARLHAGMLKAYRWQYILSGAQNPRFGEVLGSLITAEQGARIAKALVGLA